MASPAAAQDGRAAIDETLASYERIRAALAADRVDVATEARVLESAARRASAAAQGASRQHLDRIAGAAAGLTAPPSAEPDRVRIAFGEVSRATIGLLATDAALTRGRHVFECPMAQRYRKWVQTSAAISNPYMGQRMPSCGTPSTWRE